MSKKTKSAVDWSGRHTPVWTAISAAGTTLSAAACANAGGAAPGWGLAVGAAGALAGPALSHVRNRITRATAVAHGALWTGYGAWATHAIDASPWTSGSLATLAIGGVTTYGITRATGRHETAAEAQRAEEAIVTARLELEDEWVARLDRVCRIKGASILDITPWPTGQWEVSPGYSVEIQLPYGGTGVDDVARCCAALAADLRLPDGCGVEAHPGANRSVVRLDVCTVDAFANVVPYPVDTLTPLTINEPFTVGVYRNTRPATLHKRQSSTLLIGQKRSGKTNELNVMLAEFARMVDCLVWVIDFNAGNLALPWIAPWKQAHDEGRGLDVPNPGVDWVAPTPDEALRMTSAALRIAKTRKTAYQQRKLDHDTDLLPIAADVPEIVIVVDECAEHLGDHTLTKYPAKHPLRKAGDNLGEIIRIAGDSGVNVVICGLRGTTSVIHDTNIKKQCNNKIGMHTPDAAEFAYVFDGDYSLDPRDAPGQGYGFVKTGTGKPRPFKGHRLTPRAIGRIATVTAPWQPALDPVSTEVAGPDYTERWATDRCAHLFTTHPNGQAPTSDTSDAARSAPATAGHDGDHGDTEGPRGGVDLAVWTPDGSTEGDDAGDWRDLAEHRDRRHADRLRELGVDTDPDTEAEAFPHTGTADDPTDPATWTAPATTDDTAPTTPDPNGAPARERLLEVLRDAGPDGTAVGDLARTLGVSRKTTYQHLTYHLEQGTVIKIEDGARVRYALAPDTDADADAEFETTAHTDDTDAELEELIAQATELVLASQFGSGSMLMRRMRVTYSTAQRLLDALEERGIVGPAVDGRAREVLKPADWWPRPQTSGTR